jgi:hypothetical protein
MKLIAFDLDGTLAPSKSPLPDLMAESLEALLKKTPVCVISGGHLPQFEKQLLSRLSPQAAIDNLHLMPTCGTRYLRYEGEEWRTVYAHDLPPAIKEAVIDSLKTKAKALGLWEKEPFGDIIEDRGSQITFSALGQLAPEERKKHWDPSGQKRNALQNAVAAEFPQLEVRAGGSTSVDITAKGINKAYGIRKLAEHTGIACEDMLFIGDRLDPDGNDFPVISTGAKIHAVKDYTETLEVVKDIVDRLKNKDTQ